ncbi:MAG: hypothetical protein AAF170_04520 [Bacteroidota bacterium]
MIYVIIAVTFFGFIGLAFVLLFPVYRFLTREEKLSENWTQEAIARKQNRERPGGDGAASEAPLAPGDQP